MADVLNAVVEGIDISIDILVKKKTGYEKTVAEVIAEIQYLDEQIDKLTTFRERGLNDSDY